MAKLLPHQKIFCTRAAAHYHTPTTITNMVREEYGIEMPRQQAQAYDPTTHTGKNMCRELREIFFEERAKFLNSLDDVPGASKAARIRMLSDMAMYQYGKKNHVVAAALLEQCAKEVGEVFTNRTQLTLQREEDDRPDSELAAEAEAIAARIAAITAQRD